MRNTVTMNTRTARASRPRLAATAAVLAGATLLLAGCGGPSAEGTYIGSSEHTALIIQKDGKCQYTEDYDSENSDKENFDPENLQDCTWTNSDKDYTFSGLTQSKGTITGTLSDDGSLSLPDQEHWNGEIFTKQK
jgi:hypothetical protein